MAEQLITDRQLRETINRNFNRLELRELCMDLGIDETEVLGQSNQESVLNLVNYFKRHGRTDDLINYVQRARPTIDWNNLSTARQGPAQKDGGSGSAQIGGRPYQQTTLSGDVSMQGNLEAVKLEASGQVEGGLPTDLETDAAVPPNLQVSASEHITVGESIDLGADAAVPPHPFQTLPAHNGILLVERRGIRIYGLVTRKPWNLPVDAIVLPLSSGPIYNPGRLGAALEADLSRANVDDPREAFEKTVVTRSPAMLTPESPFLLMKNDSEYWTLPGSERRVIVATAGEPDGRNSVKSAANAARAIVDLAVSNGLHSLAISPLGAGSGKLAERDVALAMLDAILAALATPDVSTLSEIILTTISLDVLAAMRQRFVKRPQPAHNDQPVGRDLLQVETAVYALAEMCLLHDMNPPLAIGILGGWGSGKSFVMHLMQERVAQLRRLRVTDNTPYIGHIYQITFDAWTYAKSNLWASLMQTVFYELNAQLTRERAIARVLAEISEQDETNQEKINQFLRDDSPLWQLFTYPGLRVRDGQALLNYALDIHKQFRQTPAQELAEQAEAWLRGSAAMGTAVAEEDRLWVELRNLKARERESLRQKEQELAKTQQELEQARITLQAEVDVELENTSRKQAWQSVKNLFRQQFGLAYKHIEQQLTGDNSDKTLAATVWNGTKSLVLMIFNNPIEFLFFLIFAIVVFFLEQSVAALANLQIPEWLMPFGVVVAGWARSYSKWVTLIRDSFAMYQRQLEDERTRLEETRGERIERKMAAQKVKYLESLKEEGVEPGDVATPQNIPSLQDRVAKLQAETEQLRQRVGITAGHVSLLDFVSSRLDEAGYEKELGLMHQVQRDLQELSDSLTAEETVNSLFPRGIPRIILYIDDLDRCPPQRVVEVLEAVQLLLKTDLFIVVLAIDVRFITRALETVYKGILTRQGSPSGLDYIEKIIQIPYQVQPISEDAVAGYLEKQMTIAAEAEEEVDEDTPEGGTGAEGQPSLVNGQLRPDNDAEVEESPGDDRVAIPDLPVEAVTISRAEYALMEKCCQQIAMTPRAIKRLTNVYKLIKIIWYREGSDPTNPQMIEVVMAFLALSERYPNQARDLFSALPREIRAKSESKLPEFIQTQVKAGETETFLGQEWRQLGADATVLIPDMVVGEIDIKTFDLMRSFCFVGDIGYDPGEMVREMTIQPSSPADSQSNHTSANAQEKAK